jgi:hypothetical protein
MNIKKKENANKILYNKWLVITLHENTKPIKNDTY